MLPLFVLAAAPILSAAPVEQAFGRCATAYRASMTGKGRSDHPFDCAERAGRAGNADTTVAIVDGFARSSQAGLRYLDALAAEAAPRLGRAKLAALAADRSRYRLDLCRLHGSLTGGTVDRSNAAICAARDVDGQIGDMLALLKEDGVIPNGR